MNAAGVAMFHVGGTLTAHWSPEDFALVLGDMGEKTDGYWFLSVNDLSTTNANPPALHGESAAYWTAIDEANARLSDQANE